MLASVPAAPPEPARISISCENRPLGEVLVELMRQSNIPIDAERIDKAKKVSLTLNKLPFWEACEVIARASDHRFLASPRPGQVAFTTGPYRSLPTHNAGPFRFAVKRVTTRLDLELGTSSTDITVEVAWEPHFRSFYLDVPQTKIRAMDDQNDSLQVIDEGSGKTSATGTAIDVVLRLSKIPARANRIALLEGELRIVGTTKTLQFLFDPSQPGSGVPPERDGVGAKLQQFTKRGRYWVAMIELAYPPGGPTFESFQSYLLENEIYLRHADGARFTTKRFELGAENHGVTNVTYYFGDAEKNGPRPDDLANWRLIYRTPGRIAEYPIPFRLKDIPLR
jgi:hypothetical protein